MNNQYKGLDIPVGLNKGNLHELDTEHASCAAMYIRPDEASRFCPGILCANCICDGSHRTELRELVGIWNKEDKGVKPGMVVEYGNGCWCLVWSTDSFGVRGWSLHVEEDKLPKLSSVVRVPYEDISGVYKVKDTEGIPSGYRISSLVYGFGSAWEEIGAPVLEVTVKDIEKKYGCKVKIVGEKK